MESSRHSRQTTSGAKHTRFGRVGLRHHYQGRAAAYYDRRWATFTQHMLAPIIAHLVSVQPDKDAKVLDVGCGTGVLLAHLAEQRGELHLMGADASLDMLAQATHRLADRARLVVWNLDHPPPQEVLAVAPFDLIICTNVVHYLAKPAKTVRWLADLLTNHGQLVFADFVWHGWWWPGFELMLRLADRLHRRTLRETEIVRLFSDIGFSVVRQQRIRAGGPWLGVMFAGARKS